MTVKNGDLVTIDFIGTLEDNTVFDSTEIRKKPLSFTVGQGKVLKGIENAVIGMNVGEEKKIEIAPSNAHGDYNPDLVVNVPREQIETVRTIQPGKLFLVELKNNRKVIARVGEVSPNIVTLDANHSLAGMTLTFWIKVLDVSTPN